MALGTKVDPAPAECGAVADAPLSVPRTLRRCARPGTGSLGARATSSTATYFSSATRSRLTKYGVHCLKFTAPSRCSAYTTLQSNITTLPAGFFVNRTISRLFVSNTQLENVEEGVFEGLEDFLETLSLTQSKLKHVPKGALKDLRSLRSLELSSNNIASLESYVFYGLQLTNLQLSKNNITDVTEYAFGGLENSLEELNLIDSGQKEFPLNALRRLRSLKALRLAENEIKEIPDDGFTRFTALQRLDLSSNRIRELNERSFVTMPRLNSLSLHMNQLSDLDDSCFIHLLELEALDLSQNIIHTLGRKVLAPLRRLRTIELSSNHLHSIESNALDSLEGTELRGLVNVTELHLDGNNLRYLPLVSESLPNLQFLSLSENKIASIPSNAFKGNIELTKINLTDNIISGISKGAFRGLPSLKALDLTENLLSSINSSITDDLGTLQSLSLDGNNLTFIPNALLTSNMEELTTLTINRNPLIRFREDFTTEGSLPALRTLSIDHGNISIIASNDFLGFPSLSMLSLRHNNIVKVSPGAFKPLKKLQVLDLGYNVIEILPSERFQGIDHLQVINLTRNNIADVSRFGTDLQRLEHLDLSFNKVSRIHEGVFSSVYGLKGLWLRDNQIVWIAVNAFANLTALVSLDLRNNRLAYLSSSVLQPIEGLWEWLQDHPRLNTRRPSCAQPDKLANQSVASLHPVDFCPAPLMTSAEVRRLDHDRLQLEWDVQNGTLIGGFLVTYHATSEPAPSAGASLEPGVRRYEVDGLRSETWYTVCVTATGKYLRSLGRPTPYTADVERPYDMSTNNRKCLQVRTLARTDRTRVTLSTLGMILGGSVSAVLILVLAVLLTALKFRRRRRRRRPAKAQEVPQEYISYRHFSIQSNDGVYS
ncbi:hypothetical protein MRX96_043523 [Rhipicephalus microplus]